MWAPTPARFSPTVVTETRFGYTRFYNSAGRLLAFSRNVVDELKIPGFAGGPPVQWGVPNVTLINYSSIGDDTEGPYENKNNSLQFLNNTSVIRGKHTLRFGGEIRRDQYNQVGNQFARGQWTFDLQATQNPLTKTGGDSFAGFLLGQLYQAEAAVSIAQAQFRSNSFALYFDDTWKVTPKLTLSLGLRYERTPPWEDQTGRIFSVYMPYLDSTPQVADRSRYPKFIRQGIGTDPYAGVNLRWPNIDLLQDGRLGNRLVQTDNMDFAPRLGIAYTPTSKWVIRLGTGMFYNQDTGNPRFDMARNLAGRVRFNPSDPDFPNLTWQNALASFTSSVAQVPTPYAFANKYDRRTPYSLQYLINVQRELSRDVVFEAGYLGSVSHHLEMLRAANESLPGTVGSVISRAPYPNFGRIQLVDNGANANYNAVSAKITKRYSQGLTRAGVVHLRQVAGCVERHSRAGRRHAVPIEQLLREVRIWPLGLRHPPPLCHFRPVGPADRQGKTRQHRQQVRQRGRRRLAGGFDRDPAERLSDHSEHRRHGPLGYRRRVRPSQRHRHQPVPGQPGTHQVVQHRCLHRSGRRNLRQRRTELGGRTGRGDVRLLPPQGLQDDGKAASRIPLGVVQRRQPSGVGHAQHQRQ